ncbi:MAG: hypothetical protein ABI243_11265 [Lapillicoccus sp.]
MPTDEVPHPDASPTGAPAPIEEIRSDLTSAQRADGPREALPHLRAAADRLTDLIDETMAQAVLSGQASLRSAGAGAGLSENAVGPRLARTRVLGAYANDDGRVTASGVERAKYDQETGGARQAAPAPRAARPPMRFKPRRPI